MGGGQKSTQATVSVLEPPPAGTDATKAHALAPFAAYFPSGVNPCPGSSEPLEFDLYGSKRSKRLRTLIASKDGVSYVGKNFGEEYGHPPPCRYAVATYNKTTGKIEVAPLGGENVCRIEVRAGKADYSAEGIFGSLTDVSLRDQSKRLVGAFGSTRRRRQLDQVDNARVDATRVGQSEAVKSLVVKAGREAKASGLTRDQVMSRIVMQRNIPPHETDASTPEQAYKLQDMVPAGVRLDTGKLLSASEEDSVLDKVKKQGFVNPYVASRISACLKPKEGGNEHERKHCAKALAYLSALLNLYGTRRTLKPITSKGGIGALAKSARIQEESMEPLMEAFYERSTDDDGEDMYTRTQSLGELLLCHICVAALLAERGKMDAAQFEQLRLALKMPPPDLLMRFRECGARATVASRAKNARSYHIALLQDGKTLSESLPNIKIGRRSK